MKRVIDDQGRIFGRVNLIDAAAVLVLFLLVPVGYGAWAFFRIPSPEIVALSPSVLPPGKDLRVQLQGKNLRPFLRAQIGSQSAVLLIQSPTLGEVILPELELGSYELVLFDESQEVARRPGALTIERPAPPPAVSMADVRLFGSFTGLDRALVATLSTIKGAGQSAWGEIITLESPQPDYIRLNGRAGLVSSRTDKLRVDALIRIRCAVASGSCRVGDTVVAPGAVVSIPEKGIALKFEVAEIYPAEGMPIAEIKLLGAFMGMDRQAATALATLQKTQSTRKEWWQILSVGATEPDMVWLKGKSGPISVGLADALRLPALIRIRCTVLSDVCKVGDTVVAPNVILSIPSGGRILAFEIAELYPANATLVDVTVRFATTPEIVPLVRKDSADQSPSVLASDLRPKLITIGEIEDRKVSTSIGSFGWEQPGATFTAVVRVPARATLNGWVYENTPIRAGDRFNYVGPSYVLSGMVVDVRPQPTAASR